MTASRFKTAHVKFSDSQYDYKTSVNGKLSDEDIKAYFVGQRFDVGSFPVENMQTCIACEVTPSDI